LKDKCKAIYDAGMAALDDESEESDMDSDQDDNMDDENQDDDA